MLGIFFKSLSVCVFSVIVSLGFNTCATAQDSFLADAEKQLASSNRADRAQAIDQLVASTHPDALPLLTLLLEGQLFSYKNDAHVYLITEHEVGESARQLYSETVKTIERVRDFRRIAINNTQRTQIRQKIALVGLDAPDPKIRRQAVQQLMSETDPVILMRIKDAYTRENNPDIRELMGIILAIQQLSTQNTLALNQPSASSKDDQILEQQREAIATLATSLEPLAKNSLMQFNQTTKVPELQQLSQQAVLKIEQKVQFYKGLETLYFGLSLGSVLVLAAIGLAITFGVMGVINMAHGELIMLGAYTTFVIQQWLPELIEWSILIAIPSAFIVSALVGIAIERGVIRFLYGRPLETLLATFGISLVLQQAVRSVFSPLNQTVETPSWMSGMLTFNPVFAITLNRLYILVFCFIVFFMLLLIIKRSALGLQVRAVSQNRSMARAMGVRSERVDMLTFALGSGVAGIAGVALSQITNVGPNLGQAYIIDSFMVVVFGGVGNLWGTLVAGMTLGISTKIIEPWTGAVLAKIIILIFIILFIQKKPRGLFPQRGRAAED